MEKVKSAVSRVYGSVAAKEDSGRGHQEGARRVAQAFGYTVRPAGTIFRHLFSSLIHQIRKKSCHPSRKRPTWACHVAIRSSTPTSRRYAPHWRPTLFSALNSLNAIDLLSNPAGRSGGRLGQRRWSGLLPRRAERCTLTPWPKPGCLQFIN